MFKFWYLYILIMETILADLDLITLLNNFQVEKIEPQTVIAMTDSELMRLGVSTIGDRIRLRERCKIPPTDRDMSASSSAPVANVRPERTRLFSPGRRPDGSPDRCGKGAKGRSWTVNLLPICYVLSIAKNKRSQIFQKRLYF